MSTNLKDQVVCLISNHIQHELKRILKDIAVKYSLNEKELLDEYMSSTTLYEDTNQTEKKKRGRKKKQKDEFIETEEYDFEGVKYLVDANNNVYTFNIEEPHLIGERFVDGTISFFGDKS